MKKDVAEIEENAKQAVKEETEKEKSNKMENPVKQKNEAPVDAKKAQVLAETLTAVVFVISHIRAAGYPLSTMGEAAKHFIANWESEKYRKSVAEQK